MKTAHQIQLISTAQKFILHKSLLFLNFLIPYHHAIFSQMSLSNMYKLSSLLHLHLKLPTLSSILVSSYSVQLIHTHTYKLLRMRTYLKWRASQLHLSAAAANRCHANSFHFCIQYYGKNWPNSNFCINRLNNNISYILTIIYVIKFTIFYLTSYLHDICNRLLSKAMLQFANIKSR